MRLIVLAFAIGCLHCLAVAAEPNKHQYILPEATSLPLSELARVIGAANPNGTTASISALFDKSGREIRKRKWPAVSVVANELLLTPGDYYIAVSCNIHYGGINPRPISIRVEAGQTYSLWCVPVMMNAPVVQFRNDSHAQWAENQAASQVDSSKR